MKIIIFGATGMVGEGVLRECLEDPRVTSVLVIGRNSIRLTDPKIREILHTDFLDFKPIQDQLAGYDACFFCLGVSATGLSEAAYQRLTYDVTLAAAEALAAASPNLTFCYVSGEGTDSTEHGRSMWARVKGKTENALLRMPFKAAFMFRPATFNRSRVCAQKRFGIRRSTPFSAPSTPFSAGSRRNTSPPQ